MHLFHFKFDEPNLTRLILVNDEKYLATFIRKILDKMLPQLEHQHFIGANRRAAYQLVAPDKKITRKSVFARISMDFYGRLKLVAQDLNCYSMAQLVRELLLRYLGWVNAPKVDVQVFLQRLKSRVECLKRRCRKSGKPIKVGRKAGEPRKLKGTQLWCALTAETCWKTYYGGDSRPKLIYLT